MTETLLPASTATTIIDGFTGVVAANIGVVLGVLGFFLAVSWVTSRLNKAKKGKI